MSTQTINFHDVSEVKFNNQNVEEVVLNNQTIWPLKTPYVKFESPNGFTLGFVNNTKYWNGTIEYSLNNSTWTTWDATTPIDASTSKVVYLRGTGNTNINKTTSSYNSSGFIITGSDVSLSGNLEALFDYQNYLNGVSCNMVGHACRSLFSGQTSIVNSKNLTLPNVCPTNGFRLCFNGCSNLTSAPKLPALNIASRGYQSMFGGCFRLIEQPELPATNVGSYGYNGMFSSCVDLRIINPIKATSISSYSLLDMFAYCTSLNGVHKLNSTELPDYCYQNMYQYTHIRLSTTQSDIYLYPYSVPYDYTATIIGNSSTYEMFGESYTIPIPTPTVNEQYYCTRPAL